MATINEAATKQANEDNNDIAHLHMNCCMILLQSRVLQQCLKVQKQAVTFLKLLTFFQTLLREMGIR
jgi:hypothetical protein